MQTKTLFSQHYLQHHLPQQAEWAEDARPAMEAMRALWRKARQHGDTWNEAQTEQEFIQPALELLGWSYIVQPQAHEGGRVTRPDYALFPDEAAKAEAMPHQGQDNAFYGRARAIGEAKYWGRPLSQKDATGRETWKRGNPSHQMVSYLVGTRVPWGILTNGVTWRLYSREVSSTASEFYEIDLGLIFDFLPQDVEPSDEQVDQFRRWWLFFRRASFAPDPQGRSFIQRVHEGSATYARQISDTLKELVYEEVMPEIAGGFVAYRYHEDGVREETEESLRHIYQASLSLLYKLLFLLYAEARALLPVDHAGYREHSLTRLARWAADHLDRGLPLSEATHATARYDELLALFHRIDRGDPGLSIPRYNGGLFDPSSPENRFLEHHKLSDRAVARAVDLLVRDAGQPVDYGYIGVRNLGAIYEGLLENKLRVVDAAAGRVELMGDKGERKATGSYYTPDYIVEYIVQHTLDPILERREGAFRAAMDRVAETRRQLKRAMDPTANRLLQEQRREAERDAREAFLGIKVLDPAMGSGHFLVNAVDHLTDAIIRRMQVYHDEHADVPWEWNPIQGLIERVRGEIRAEMDGQGIGVDEGRLDDTALLTRLVMKRCIYGVDLNRMAVELAKVSLWLHTFTVGAPLSFLDHHLRWGNSLIGTDVRTVEGEIQRTESGQFSLWQGPFAGLLDLTGWMIEVVERADATLADVHQSAETFERFQQGLVPFKRVLDLWVSRHFDNEGAEEFLTVHGDEVLPALKGEREVPEAYEAAIARARALYEEKRFFHWDLEFPEVFVDLRKRDWAEDPGFDAVIGNPPYVRQEQIGENKPYFQACYTAYHGTADLYVYFIEQGMNTLKEGGEFGFIVSNKFMRAGYGSSLRELLVTYTRLREIVDFGELPVFEEAAAFPAIVLFRKEHDSESSQTVDVARMKTLDFGSLKSEVERLAHKVDNHGLTSEGWSLSARQLTAVLRKLERTGVSLEQYARGEVYRGIVTGCNEIFIIDQATRNRLVAADPTSKELVKALVVGDDVRRYEIGYKDQFIIFTRRGVNLERYPAIKQYLEQHRPRLEPRPPDHKGAWPGRKPGNYQWYEIQDTVEYWELFEQPKIVYPDIAKEARFAIDLTGLYPANTIYLIPREDYFLLALLNSSLMFFFMRHKSAVLGDPEDRGRLRFFGQYMEQLPIHCIAFTTPPNERERLAAEGRDLAARATRDAQHAPPPYAAFPGSPLGSWLEARLSADPEQSDAVHDLLAHLAEGMIELHQERQRLERALDPFKYLDRGAPFVKLPEAFAQEIKYGQRLSQPVDLGEVHHDIDGLRLARAGDGWELQVLLKLRDPAEGWRAWQYEEGGHHIARAWAPAYRLSLSEAKARYYRHALPVLDAFAEAGSFPGGYTRSTAKKLQRTRVPAFDAEADLAPLAALSEELSQVRATIAATDRLIDLIVYRLYGLTEEEVAVVEGR